MTRERLDSYPADSNSLQELVKKTWATENQYGHTIHTSSSQSPMEHETKFYNLFLRNAEFFEKLYEEATAKERAIWGVSSASR